MLWLTSGEFKFQPNKLADVLCSSGVEHFLNCLYLVTSHIGLLDSTKHEAGLTLATEVPDFQDAHTIFEGEHSWKYQLFFNAHDVSHTIFRPTLLKLKLLLNNSFSCDIAHVNFQMIDY